jgi:hypothetical protein
MEHADTAALEAGLEHIRASPKHRGTVELIVRRPAEGEREAVTQATLDPVAGLVGDSWSVRGSDRNGPDEPNRGRQLTMMNARVAHVLAGPPEGWLPAGDQLYVDLDLSSENLAPGTRLLVGSALIEISHEPHLGCGKFLKRFGVDAQRFVNSAVGRELKLRGVNATVLETGTVRVGDVIELASAA